VKTVRIVSCLLVIAVACPGVSFGSESSAADPAPKEAAAGKPITLRFERKWEPNERAFSILVPADWTLQGGMFHVDPTQAGGPGNSIDGKCDVTIKKDAEGTVAFRSLPSWNYADFSRNPQMAFAASMFPAGSRYQGMEVRPMPSCAQYLQGLFAQLRPGVSEVKVVQSMPIPELAEVFRTLFKSVDEQQRMMGFPALAYDAGGLVVDYTEGGRRFREAVVTCLIDFRAAAAMWSNQYTLDMRAPADEANDWKPVFDIIRQSVQFNPQWVAAAARAAGQRGKTVEETMKAMQSIDQQIYENRARINANIQHENYLLLTSQDEYVNPFTGKIEQDTNEYKRRWTTEQGDMIYTDQDDFNPNAVKELNHQTWKLTPVRPR
jgi:hypothetical protein